MICRLGDQRYWRHDWGEWVDGTGTFNSAVKCMQSYDVSIQGRTCQRCKKRIIRRVAPNG